MPYITNVAGLLHHRLLKTKGNPFKLMHAKVALLLYECLDSKNENKQQLLRLIVSTGNWTGQTLSDSLDMSWWADLPVDSLKNHPKEQADLAAALDFFIELSGHYERYDQAGQLDQNSMPLSIISSLWKNLPTPASLPRPRFIDSRQAPLLDKIVSKVADISPEKGNCLIVGSGFFEKAEGKKALEVPKQIIDGLTGKRSGSGAKLLTQGPWKYILVNPHDCQGVATAVDALREDNWNIYPAFDSQGSNRFLHAKFIFCAKYLNTTDNYTSSWLYLGSGNMTSSGLLEKASAGRGNLEAGVVLDLQTISSDEFYANFPFNPQWDEDGDKSHELPDGLTAGEGYKHSESETIAPPVSILKFSRPDEHNSYLEGSLTQQAADCSDICFFAVNDPTKLVFIGEATEASPDFRLAWTRTEAPTYVVVTWQTPQGQPGSEWVPVIGEDGRLAAPPRPPICGDDLLSELLSFPHSPPQEIVPDPKPSPKSTAAKGFPNDLTQTTPIHLWANIIEKIAEKQCGLRESQWSDWCQNLRQVLVRLQDENLLKVNVNVLSPLLALPFIPYFAQDQSGKAYEEYEKVLRDLMQKWEIDKHPSLEG